MSYHALPQFIQFKDGNCGRCCHTIRLPPGMPISHIRVLVQVQLLYFWSSFMLMHSGRRQMMAQLLGSLSLTSETWMVLRAPGYSLAELWFLWALQGVNQQTEGNVCVSLFLFPFIKIKKLTYFKNRNILKHMRNVWSILITEDGKKWSCLINRMAKRPCLSSYSSIIIIPYHSQICPSLVTEFYGYPMAVGKQTGALW